MRALPPTILATALATLLMTPPVLQSAEWKTVRHSGTIVTVDRASRTIVVAEVGPWQTRDGVTVITPVRAEVTSSATFSEIARVPEAPSGFRDDFVETPLEPWRLAAGDFVTLECRHEGTRLRAVGITVMRLPAS